jgi:hypothetical protein
MTPTEAKFDGERGFCLGMGLISPESNFYEANLKPPNNPLVALLGKI